MMRMLSLLLLDLCACVVSVVMWLYLACEVVLVPYVDVVVVVTVMCVLLFVLQVCMLRECDGDGNADVGSGGVVIVASARCEYMGGTRGSGFVSTSDDVLLLLYTVFYRPCMLVQVAKVQEAQFPYHLKFTGDKSLR